MPKLPIPPFAWPAIFLWLIAIPVSLTKYHPPFLSYRLFTGLLFFGAIAASVVWLILGLRAEKRRQS